MRLETPLYGRFQRGRGRNAGSPRKGIDTHGDIVLISFLLSSRNAGSPRKGIDTKKFYSLCDILDAPSRNAGSPRKGIDTNR